MASSGASTPRFTAQAATTEDLLKSQTVGLVRLDEFRKRRRELEELKAQDTQNESDGTLTPKSDDGLAAPAFGKKKKKRKVGGALLSFGADEGEDTIRNAAMHVPEKADRSSQTKRPDQDAELAAVSIKRRVTPNPTTLGPAPKVMTKASLAAEVAERERLRKEFLDVQIKVRDSEVCIPFVFYDGSNIPGGKAKIKKGDHIWLLLEKCRKIGAEMGFSGDSSDHSGLKMKADGRKSWARIGVDDLMCVRGDVIIPHHYEIYYFIANQVADPSHPERQLFDFSGTSNYQKPREEEVSLLRRPKEERLEGFTDDPSYTKIVDRRWYERNKHIYPASTWTEYKAGKEFEDLAKGKKDAQGNSFFFN